VLALPVVDSQFRGEFGDALLRQAEFSSDVLISETWVIEH
jgi:hypothetical protein